MISRKYGDLVGGWNTSDIKCGYGIGLWKDIRKDWHTLSQNAIFSLGDSRRLWCWKDIWCGEVALSNTFPNLFNMAVHKEAVRYCTVFSFIVLLYCESYECVYI